MAEKRIRRLDRSHPIVSSRVHLHDYLKEELLQISQEHEVSTGLYLTTLLNSVRNPDGSLPDLRDAIERSRRLSAA